MASLVTPAHVSNIKPFQYSTGKTNRVWCELSPPPSWREGRRMVSISLLLSPFLLIPNRICLLFLFHFLLFHALLLYIELVLFSMLQVLMLKEILWTNMLRGRCSFTISFIAFSLWLNKALII